MITPINIAIAAAMAVLPLPYGHHDIKGRNDAASICSKGLGINESAQMFSCMQRKGYIIVGPHAGNPARWFAWDSYNAFIEEDGSVSPLKP